MMPTLQPLLVPTDRSTPCLELVPLADLPPNEQLGGLEPRKDFIASLKENGLLSPIRLSQTEAGYRVVYGRRRVRAARLLGWTHIAALVAPAMVDDDVASVQENVARYDDHLQELRLVLTLAAQGASPSQIHRVLPSRTVSQIKKMLKLLVLPPRVVDAILAGRILLSAAYDATAVPRNRHADLERLVDGATKVVGPKDIVPLRAARLATVQTGFEELLAQEVPTAQDVARAHPSWQARASAVLRELLSDIPMDHPVRAPLGTALASLDDSGLERGYGGDS